MNDQSFKQLFTFFIFVLSFAWAVLALWITVVALDSGETTSILAMAGVDTFMGSLLTMDILIVQHWFRRAKPA